MKKTKRIWVAGLIACAAFAANAALIHSYDFAGTNPLADDTGSVDLVNNGGATINSGGYATLDGSDDFLAAPVQHSGNYTVSVWFRFSTINGSVLANRGVQTFSAEKWSMTAGDGIWTTDAKNSSEKADLVGGTAANEWHLATFQADGANFGYWMDGNDYVSISTVFTANSKMETLHLGLDYKDTRNFAGDIADVRMYNDVDWSNTLQDAAYVAGPSLVPEPATMGLVGLAGLALVFLRRRMRA
jgi:hypothetical protein